MCYTANGRPRLPHKELGAVLAEALWNDQVLALRSERKQRATPLGQDDLHQEARVRARARWSRIVVGSAATYYPEQGLDTLTKEILFRDERLIRRLFQGNFIYRREGSCMLDGEAIRAALRILRFSDPTGYRIFKELLSPKA